MFFWKRVRNLLVTYLMLLTAPVWVFPFCLFVMGSIVYRVKIKKTEDDQWHDDFNMFFKGDRMLVQDSHNGIEHKSARVMGKMLHTTRKLLK